LINYLANLNFSIIILISGIDAPINTTAADSELSTISTDLSLSLKGAAGLGFPNEILSAMLYPSFQKI
jgi:hypothetical protein